MVADREAFDLLPAAVDEAEPPSSADPKVAVWSVDRAMRILEILGRDGSMTAASMAVELGIRQSTALRLLTSTGGLVEQTAWTQRYRLSLALIPARRWCARTLDLTARSPAGVCS
jgi:DNA-binding IclR family transcriptional regulator